MKIRSQREERKLNHGSPNSQWPNNRDTEGWWRIRLHAGDTGNVVGHGEESTGSATDYWGNHDLVSAPLFGFSVPFREGGVCP